MILGLILMGTTHFACSIWDEFEAVMGGSDIEEFGVCDFP
jgi:hypothetical protein